MNENTLKNAERATTKAAPDWTPDTHLRIEALRLAVSLTGEAMASRCPLEGTIASRAEKYLAFLKGEG